MPLDTHPALALAAFDNTGVLRRHIIQRRQPLPTDVVIDIKFSGCCHSDVHQLRSEWDQTCYYPMVPGHEIAGVVREVGKEVDKFSVGQKVGVGVFVDSCRNCEYCDRGLEQYCKEGMHGTYNACLKKDKYIKLRNSEYGELLFGGYSTSITVDQRCVVHIPDSIPLERAGPLLCAGITTYSPLRYFGKMAEAAAGTSHINVGVAGFGGLGHMAVKLAKAMGYTVTVLSRSDRKKDAALACGATHFINTAKPGSCDAHKGSLHLIIDTISADHSVGAMMGSLLSTDGILCLVGLPPNEVPIRPFDVVGGRKIFSGSMIGGMPELQEMVNFCAEHQCIPDVEIIDGREINRAIYELSQNANSANRFVIDVQGSMTPNITNEAWQTDDEPRIDPTSWKPHPNNKVFPPSANVLSSSASLTCNCDSSCACAARQGTGECACQPPSARSGVCNCDSSCGCAARQGKGACACHSPAASLSTCNCHPSCGCEGRKQGGQCACHGLSAPGSRSWSQHPLLWFGLGAAGMALATTFTPSNKK